MPSAFTSSFVVYVWQHSVVWLLCCFRAVDHANFRTDWALIERFVVDEGVYGDVHRVKILFNKKDTALIQMAEPHQAQLGNFIASSCADKAEVLTRFCCCSHDSLGQDQAVRQAIASDAVQAPGRPDAEGGPTGRRSDQGLCQLVAAPLQEAGQQELPEHLPALVHASFVQYSVSPSIDRHEQPILNARLFYAQAECY